jgi:hypothetical protein
MKYTFLNIERGLTRAGKRRRNPDVWLTILKHHSVKGSSKSAMKFITI